MGTKARLLSVGKGNETEQVLEWGKEMDTQGGCTELAKHSQQTGKKRLKLFSLANSS